MRAISKCLLSALLFTTFTMTHSSKNPAERANTENGPSVHRARDFDIVENSKPLTLHSLHRRRHSGRRRNRKAMSLRTTSSQPDNWVLEGGPELEGLSPVRLEMGSSEWGDTGGIEGMEERPHTHNTGHKMRAPTYATGEIMKLHFTLCVLSCFLDWSHQSSNITHF